MCDKPERNTYCVGSSSYPGEFIREHRDLQGEKKQRGKPFAELDTPPACMYSASAFSDRPNEIYSDPPGFFNDDTERRVWTIPAATACTWPYEAMYHKPDIKNGSRYDYDKRLAYAEEHFAPLVKDKSLVFYYANYSNPLSDDENPAYLLVGVARIKAIAPILYYENCSERTLDRYKGFIWQKGITSHYPEQGLRLPYHRYLEQPDDLRKFAVVPENTNLCKYATKQVSDDDALGLLEQLLEAVRIVRDDLQDDSENWDLRIQWLESLIGELWRSRGAYPGMPGALEYLGLQEAISGFREQVESCKEAQAAAEVKAFIDGKRDDITGYYPLDEELDDLRREVALRCDSPTLLLEVLARCALSAAQIEAILDEGREQVGITASLEEIERNPYLLAEQYTGTDSTDTIRWSLIDRGMLPSPELSAEPRFKKNAKERIRALLLETLRHNRQQTFMRAADLLEQVNHRIKAQPEWKQNFVTEKYLKADRRFHEPAIYQRDEDGTTYLYDRYVWDDERLVQSCLDGLLVAPDIPLARPLPKDFWQKLLFREESALAHSARADYQVAVNAQAEACATILPKRFGAITGGAGTGKTTILAALIKAIKKTEGEGTGVAIIAPTGKATDRLRGSFADAGLESVNIATIHSILARYGWLNDNLTFKRRGGKQVSDFSTVIIDESSMIDLSLMAALFRAIDWSAVRRLILVGDAAQLPPIGVGKVYADVVSYLRKQFPEQLVELSINLRQMENRVEGRGNGILRLADAFINSAVRGDRDQTEEEAVEREQLIAQLHVGGEVDQDLQVTYWNEPENLQRLLNATITEDLRAGDPSDTKAAKVWGDCLRSNVNAFQILSPVRGELYGTESINLTIQAFKSEYWLKKGAIDGITLFDKVIQIRNRPASNPLHGFNFSSRDVEPVEVFNGEIGNVVPTGSDWKKFKAPGFRLKNFSVKFCGKEEISVNFGFPDKPDGNLELAYAISVHKCSWLAGAWPPPTMKISGRGSHSRCRGRGDEVAVLCSSVRL